MPASIKFRSRKAQASSVSVSGAAFGLQVSLHAPDSATLDLMRSALPPSWVKGASAEIEMRFGVTTEDHTEYDLTFNGRPAVENQPLDFLIEMLPGLVRKYVASTAPELVFIHAGAVAHKGRGIVIPGKSFSGKTTLVAALVRAGAQYYSDEYAVITRNGQLIPYAQDLSMRMTAGERQQTPTNVSAFGGTAAQEPVEIGFLILTEYRSSAAWQPTELTVAQGVVEALGHAEPIQDRPMETIKAISLALSGATVLQGRRGDADKTAAALLDLLD
jgi:hypothetical protein